MGFFSKIIKLFTTESESESKSKPAYPSEQYKGMIITPQPLSDHGQFRVAALIEKVEDGDQESKQHQFIRSDTVASADLAATLALSKCKVFIDQMGDNIFD
jgi:hypothetical protein